MLVIANYLQRYCLKNDTIGFYGPVGWADAGSGAAGLAAALAVLAETFERVTGSPATRRAGENYAGRTVVYQDAVRDVRVELGRAVTGALTASWWTARGMGSAIGEMRRLSPGVTVGKADSDGRPGWPSRAVRWLLAPRAVAVARGTR